MMKARAKEVNIEFLMWLSHFFRTTSQMVPTTTPASREASMAMPMVLNMAPTLMAPVWMPLKTAKATIRQTMSLRADSRKRIISALGPGLTCESIETTTAEEVPPTAAPRNRQCRSVRSSRKRPTRKAMTMTQTKLSIVSRVALPMDCLRVWGLRLVPLSKRMTIRVIVVNTLPNWPRSAGEMRCSTGPTTRPISISSRTLGILVFTKRALNV